jgi:hypothetical protein
VRGTRQNTSDFLLLDRENLLKSVCWHSRLVKLNLVPGGKQAAL